MNSKELMELLGRAFTYGEIDALIPHMAENCDYVSEYSGKKYFCAEDIIGNMREVFSNLDDTCGYTYKLVPLDSVLREITVDELDNMEGMHPNPWVILLYQFDDETPAALVVTMVDLEGRLRSICLSRDNRKFNISFDGDVEEDSPQDLPGTVTPLNTKDRHRRELQQAFSGQPRKEQSKAHPKYYIWRKADEFVRPWLEGNGYTVLESKIFKDCIGYRCNRKGYAYTVFMYAYGQKRTTQLDGEHCKKLADLPFAANSTVLVVYLNVKRFRKGGEYNYRVCNYCGDDIAPDLWRLSRVNDQFILEYYPRKEMMDATWKLMYAFNRDSADVYECIIAEKNPSFQGIDSPGFFLNDAFYFGLNNLRKEYGRMKLGYVRYNDVIYSAVPYLDGYGFFSFRCDNRTDRIQEVTAYPFAGGDRKVAEFIKADLREPESLYDYVPKLINAIPLPPVETERFAVKLYWDNGECRKYVFPLALDHEHDEVISFRGYVFTDKIWASVKIANNRPDLFGRLRCGTAITFKNEMFISALLCYQEGVPFSEPEQAEQIVYEDDRHRLRKLWTWDAKSIYEDEETGLLKTLISGEAFNWYGRSSFATPDGRRCTSLDFDYIDNFHEGRACVAIQGRGYGYVDSKMNVVIPLIYERADSFADGKAKVRRNGRWFFIDRSGQEIPIKEAAISGSYQDVGEYCEGLCRVSTLKLRFMDLAYHSDYQHIAGTWGFVDESGEVVVPPQYIYANDFEDGIAIVCKGKWTIDPKWDNKYNQGRYWTETEMWGGIDREGNEVIPFIFDEIKHFDDTSEVFMAHIGGWPDGKWGVIDRRGNWLAEPIFEDFGYDYWDGLITFYAEGKWSGDDTPIGIYDLKNKKVLFEPQFLDVDLNEDGTIQVEIFDEKLGRTVAKMLDRTGKELFPSEYSSIHTWKEPYEVIIRDEAGDRHGLIDKAGNVLLTCKYPAVWNGIRWKEKRIVFEENGKQGLMDFDDHIIIPAIYHEIYGLDKPLLTVRTGNQSNDPVGLLSQTGKVILPAEYSSISWLRDRTHLICRKNGRCEMYEYTQCSE